MWHSLKDRLAGYIHWQSRANFDQATLICRRQAGRVDLATVRSWCEAENASGAFDELMRHLELDESFG